MDTNTELKLESDNTDEEVKLDTDKSLGDKDKNFKIEDSSLENKEKIKVDNENEPINKKPKLSKNEEDEQEDNDAEMSVEHEIPTEGFIYPLEQDASDMLDEVDFDGHFPSVTERYFTPYYQIDVQKPGDDICIRIHSNRICMISLAPSHIIFHENKTIESCNYKVSDKLDRLKNKVSGKSKHGAQPLQSNSNLCCLTCTDGSKYMVKCCMIGKLIEVNERLVQNPELLKKQPHLGGYIAIVLPNLRHLDKTREKLLTQELYEEALKKREDKKEEQKEQVDDIKSTDGQKELDQVTDMEIFERKEKQKNKQVTNTENLKEEKKEKKQIANMEAMEEQKNIGTEHIGDIEMIERKEQNNEQVVKRNQDSEQYLNIETITTEKGKLDEEVTNMDIVES